jgi:hypothetical protein
MEKIVRNIYVLYMGILKIKILSVNFKGRDRLGYLGVNDRIIL